MAISATVREWHEDEGWGVLDSAETPGGCWAHFGAAAVAGYATFEPGQAVTLEWEPADQDGYAYRATRLWPAGEAPADRSVSGSGGAYTSTLTLSFDPPPEPAP
jgi:CspA family cold shock protein